MSVGPMSAAARRGRSFFTFDVHQFVDNITAQLLVTPSSNSSTH